MKYNLRDELDLLIGLRKGETQEESVDFKSTDKSKVHKFAQETLKKLYRLRLPTLEPPKEYSPGQVWQTKTCDERFPSGPFGPKSFVLTTVEKEAEVSEILGVPISEEWRFATPSDLVVGPGGGMPQIYDEWVMIELGMETFIPREAISRYMGEVSDELFAQIQSILNWLDGEEVEREFLDAEKVAAENGANLGPPMERWVLTDPVTGQKHKVLMGQQIAGEDDPRLVYKRLVTEDLNYIILPVVKREQEAWEEAREKKVPIKERALERFPEIAKKLGSQVKERFEPYFPPVITALKSRLMVGKKPKKKRTVKKPVRKIKKGGKE